MLVLARRLLLSTGLHHSLSPASKNTCNQTHRELPLGRALGLTPSAGTQNILAQTSPASQRQKMADQRNPASQPVPSLTENCHSVFQSHNFLPIINPLFKTIAGCPRHANTLERKQTQYAIRPLSWTLAVCTQQLEVRFCSFADGLSVASTSEAVAFQRPLPFQRLVMPPTRSRAGASSRLKS